MTDPARTLADQAMADVIPLPGANAAGVKKVLNHYAGAFQKAADKRAAEKLGPAIKAQYAEQLSAITQLNEAHDAELRRTALDAARERKEHGRHRYHAGALHWGISGLVIGIVGACVLMSFIIVPFNEQTRASTEAGVMIGTAVTSQSGEPLVPPEMNENYTRAPREPADAEAAP